jgi:hypothetical protein
VRHTHAETELVQEKYGENPCTTSVSRAAFSPKRAKPLVPI